MRLRICVMAFGLILMLPAWAQHGGHGGFSGGHAGFGAHAGGGSGHIGGGHFSGSMRGGNSSRGFNSRQFSSRSLRSRPFNGRGFSGRPFLHDNFRRGYRRYGFRNCIGCWRGYGYPWWGGYYDPWWWNSNSSYDEDYERNLATANEMNQQSLEQQQMLRQEEREGDQDVYQSASPGGKSQSGSDAQTADASAPTVLVFRDQHRREISNYAIVGQTLWNFTSPRTEKIPLSELDLAATQKVNDDRGVTFRVPGSGEAQ